MVNVNTPYCDCKYSGEDMSNPNPQCEYITPDYILEAKVASTKATSKSGKAEPWICIKKYIHNAFMSDGVQL